MTETTITERIPASRIVDGDRIFSFTQDVPFRVLSYDKSCLDIVVLTCRDSDGQVFDQFFPPNAKVTVVRRVR